MTTVCQPCQTIANDVDDIQGQLDDLGEELKHPRRPKDEIMADIRAAMRELAQKNHELQQCEIQNGCISPPLQFVQGTLSTAMAELLTDNSDTRLDGPFIVNVQMTLVFEGIPGNPWTVTRVDLVPITRSISGITVTVTVKQLVKGDFKPDSGTMNLDLILHVQASGPFVDSNSDVELAFTTSMTQSGPFSAQGTPFLRDSAMPNLGSIGLVAAGQATGGIIDKNHVFISLANASASNWPRS